MLLAQSAMAGPAAPVRLLDGRALEVECGVRNQPFLSWCAAQGAGGFEFLSGIPGTLGGAAAVNAGAFGRSMADVLLGADILDAGGKRRAVDAGYFGFSYRDSRFKFGKDILLSLRLAFRPESESAISKKIRENLEYRLARHPSYRLASAGCFFKNPLRRRREELGREDHRGVRVEEHDRRRPVRGGRARQFPAEPRPGHFR